MAEILTRKLRIVVVDDHVLFREGVDLLLSREEDLEVAGKCGSLQDAVPLLARHAPDLVLLDIDLGDERGTHLCRLMRELGVSSKILVVTAGIPEAEVVQVLAEGASGILLKSNEPAVLLRAIREVLAGRSWIDPRLVPNAPASPHDDLVARLTPRERSVLLAMLDGLSNKEIASQLSISENAVKSALQQLFVKTGVRTRSQLVRIAIEHIRERSRPPARG